MGGQRHNLMVEQQFHSLFRLTPNTVAPQVPIEMFAWVEQSYYYKLITENMTDLIALVDAQRRFQYVSPSYTTVLGYDADTLIGVPVVSFIHEDDLKKTCDKIHDIFSFKQSGKLQYRLRHASGTYLTLETTYTPILDEFGYANSIVLSSRDITEKKRNQELITHLAYHDALTGLPNRTLFQDLLTTALEQQRDGEFVAVLFLDLDQFKIINDTMGHAAGDELLIQAARRLQFCFSNTYQLCRISGDEFTIIVSELPDHAAAEEVAQHILDVMKKPFQLYEHTIFLTCSIGIAIGPDHGNTPEMLMQNADSAMYQSKQNGKNKYEVYHYTVNQRMAKRLELEVALRKAIDEEEFSLYYQPLVNTKTHDIYAAEALIRWITQAGDVISPTDFIPLAEETGLIVELGAWVLRQACLQVTSWQEEMFKPIRISVNLSTRQFQDPDFLDKVKLIVSETNVAPQWIGLEITESLIMKDVDYAIGTLRELQHMGFEISIDDFGTGYSSLGYLKTLPIDKLKIDQTFIRELTTKQEDKTITKAIISLAHNLGLKVIAEGVETEDHVDFLTQEKCDELQGYYFSRPLSATDFARCLQPQQATTR